MDLVNLKPEGADYLEYYTISFEDVKIEIPVKDVVIPPTPPSSGGRSRNYGGGGGGLVPRDLGTGFGREQVFENDMERRENIK
jgi:hypothetical protein